MKYLKVMARVATLYLVGNLTAVANQSTSERGEMCSYASSEDFFEDWQPVLFPGQDNPTNYTWEQSDSGDCWIHAQSSGSASGIVYLKEFDLNKTPWLSWSWKVKSALKTGDARTKSGDDYAARVYVLFDTTEKQLNWWQTLKYQALGLFYSSPIPKNAVTYLWANELTIGESIHNPYHDQTRMIAVESGDERSGQWVAEARNVAEDYQHLFGRPAPKVIGLAIMTDSDDSGESAEAWYGDIRLAETPKKASMVFLNQ